MVEPVSLTLGALVAALVAKAGETAGEKAVEGGAGVLRGLLERLRKRLSSEGDATTETALARVEDAPDSPSRAQELASALDARAEQDPAFADELRSLVAEAKGAGVDVETITQTIWGNQNVQAAGLTDSEVNVSYGGGGTRKAPGES